MIILTLLYLLAKPYCVTEKELIKLNFNTQKQQFRDIGNENGG